MKKLYIKFYENKFTDVAMKKEFVCVDNCGRNEMNKSIKNTSSHITIFLKNYPHGKTEFSWE